MNAKMTSFFENYSKNSFGLPNRAWKAALGKGFQGLLLQQWLPQAVLWPTPSFLLTSYSISCNSDYRKRYCDRLRASSSLYSVTLQQWLPQAVLWLKRARYFIHLFFVATVITASGIVTDIQVAVRLRNTVATLITACGIVTHGIPTLLPYRTWLQQR